MSIPRLNAASVLAIVLAFVPSAFSQGPPISDPQAIALAAKSIAVLTGGTVINDVSLIGDATSFEETGSQKGAITMMAKGTGESRIDLNLGSETWAENHSPGLIASMRQMDQQMRSQTKKAA